MIRSWLSQFQFAASAKKPAQPRGYVYFLGQADAKTFEGLMEEHALDWQMDSLRQNDKEFVYFSGKKGPVWILKPKENLGLSGHWSLMSESSSSWSRDMAGSLLGYFRAHQLQSVQLEFINTEDAQEKAALAGLEIAAYNFREIFEGKTSKLPQVWVKKGKTSIQKAIIKEAQTLAGAVNIARHFVNLPPNVLHPASFPSMLKKLRWGPQTRIEVWNAARLKKEKCLLHFHVGAGSAHPPCLVHIRYRPKKKRSRPIAVVGKGVTFDTGGLDIKPSSGMRLMKKDMGGAAAVLGVAWWVSQSQLDIPCDFYLALAENSVDGNSYRPSDVIVSRAGFKVEIDNTDAEGRLVLADALDVAVTQKGADEPDTVINVATLTGAIKVALGAECGGLFSNDDELAEELLDSAQRQGDPLWRMPLIQKYFSGMNSPFADFKNSADGFGGAITAALFLEKFVRNKKWAHLDIYSWADKGHGPITAGGGNGQAVQCLIDYLSRR